MYLRCILDVSRMYLQYRKVTNFSKNSEKLQISPETIVFVLDFLKFRQFWLMFRTFPRTFMETLKYPSNNYLGDQVQLWQFFRIMY